MRLQLPAFVPPDCLRVVSGAPQLRRSREVHMAESLVKLRAPGRSGTMPSSYKLARLGIITAGDGPGEVLR